MSRYIYYFIYFLCFYFYFYPTVSGWKQYYQQSTPILNHCKPNNYSHYTLNLLNYSQVFFYSVSRSGFMEGADWWGPKNCSWDIRCPKGLYVVKIECEIRERVLVPESDIDVFADYPNERCHETACVIIQFEEDIHCHNMRSAFKYTAKSDLMRLRIAAPNTRQTIEFMCRAFCLYADTLQVPVLNKTEWEELIKTHHY